MSTQIDNQTLQQALNLVHIKLMDSERTIVIDRSAVPLEHVSHAQLFRAIADALDARNGQLILAGH